MTATTNSSIHINLEDPNSSTSSPQPLEQQLSPLLPKEAEYVERKRPLAIQELLEKKRARLATIPKQIQMVENDSSNDLQHIFNKFCETKLDQNKNNENDFNQICEDNVMFYNANGGEDVETASCSSGGCPSFNWALFEGISGSITPSINSQKQPKNVKINNMTTPLLSSPLKNCLEFSPTSSMEIGDNALAKSVPCDRLEINFYKDLGLDTVGPHSRKSRSMSKNDRMVPRLKNDKTVPREKTTKCYQV
ncbi:unnamed protein product [Meloidogyne enterolobii]|uniref:Uncharacterized protein n=1 Tax=Meloidogyne enterolobii TaxID=390850 RepID=A0ACB0Y685_MELEN